MKFSRRFQQQSEVSSSSISDIAFLLLIFFMVTTAFAAKKGIDFRLPGEAAEKANTQPVPAVSIEIGETGALSIDGVSCNLTEIQSIVEPHIRKKPDRPVIIQVHDNAVYGNMIDVLDELKQVGVTNIVLPE